MATSDSQHLLVSAVSKTTANRFSEPPGQTRPWPLLETRPELLAVLGILQGNASNLRSSMGRVFILGSPISLKNFDNEKSSSLRNVCLMMGVGVMLLIT